MKRSEIAHLIDHTLLKPESTAADVAALVAEGRRLGVKASSPARPASLRESPYFSTANLTRAR